MICPMKFALNNCKDYSCSEKDCAWWSEKNVSCIMLQLDRLEDICYKLEVLAEVV